MKIIKIDYRNPDQKAIVQTVNCLQKGGILVYPTDTCYGLGADATDHIAIKKIYKIKNRSTVKPLSIIVKDIAQIKKIALVNNQQKAILKKHLPGPFTFILEKNNRQTLNQSTVGIRIPNYKITELLSNQFSHPYITTSANLAGNESCYTLDCLLKQFKNAKHQPDLILDTGSLPHNPPSTVVDLTQQPPLILRQGRGTLSSF